MLSSKANRPHTASGAPQSTGAHEREALVSLIALLFIEDHGLLNAHQLASARRGLDALFIEASSEETMLRKLIDTLAAQKAVDRSFSDLARILDGIDRGLHTAHEKIDRLKSGLTKQAISAEEHAAFIGPFLSFSHDLTERFARFRRLMNAYLDAREQEARAEYVFDIARKARERLKRRFEKGLRGDSESKQKLTSQAVQSFDFAGAETDHGIAAREAARVRDEIETVLREFHEMCQYAMSPEHRDTALVDRPFKDPAYADIYSLYVSAREKYEDLVRVQADIHELFWLFQHAYGISRVDFDHFERAMTEMRNHTEMYFRSKHEDEDVRSTRDKLVRIEALITFLESCAHFLSEGKDDAYVTFSRAVSDTINSPDAPWSAIAGELLHMKVTAEAELSARLA